jgi:predicted dithiol-disulfide oxidoreductase (DUF899 family)
MSHPIVSRQEWISARKALLTKEKQLTRQRDQLAAERRNLPWVKIEKAYVFDGPSGKMTLQDLFQGRSQLVIQHFMFGPDWEEGCVGCSFGADHADAARQHFEHRDLSFAAVSRTALSKIEAFRRRMGWRFLWVSSLGSDFNYDFDVSFTKEQIARGKVTYNYAPVNSQSEDLSGISVFYKDEAGGIYHTYSTYGRGVEVMMGTYAMLDLTPKGRGERDVDYKMEWVRHHDRYDPAPTAKPAAHACCARD